MAVAWLFSLWHLAQFRNLFSAARSARRTVTRLRLVIAARYGPAHASPPASCLTFSHSNKTDLADCLHRATVFTPTSISSYRTLCLTPHNLWKVLRMQHKERDSIVWDKFCCNSSFGAPPTNTVYMSPLCPLPYSLLLTAAALRIAEWRFFLAVRRLREGSLPCGRVASSMRVTSWASLHLWSSWQALANSG